MSYDPGKHHRRSIRLKGYDYSEDGWYFVTICVQGGQCLLGEVVDGEIILSERGQIVADAVEWLEEQYSHVVLDAWCVMPNHVHMIVVLVNGQLAGSPEQGGSRTAPTKRKSLGRLIGAFKTVSTKGINELQEVVGVKFWQRDFYEHVIRNERELNAIRQYIIDNAANWRQDKLHPDTSPNQFNQNW